MNNHIKRKKTASGNFDIHFNAVLISFLLFSIKKHIFIKELNEKGL